MSLTGTYLRTVDDKQRLAIPKKLKEGLTSETDYTVYLAPETDRALTLYSGSEFERRASLLVDLAAQRAEVRNYQRLYYSQAEQIEIDGQGRIRLPERLIEFAGIEQEVVLLGVHNRVEIWDRVRWDDFLKGHREDFDKMSSAALG
ncbi:MAG: division/cell wall cluster transcriptional repressor MraZ [Planctomycetaceae bacterium]|nr:division/cell wall cluster transcriptional repressor MraZ [Planctomycetaceae bacterium]